MSAELLDHCSTIPQPHRFVCLVITGPVKPGLIPPPLLVHPTLFPCAHTHAHTHTHTNKLKHTHTWIPHIHIHTHTDTHRHTHILYIHTHTHTEPTQSAHKD